MGVGQHNNADNVGPLKTKLNTVQDSLSPWEQEFIVTDYKDLKGRYGEAHLVVSLAKWNEKAKAVDAVARAHKTLIAMHREHCKD